MFVQYNLRLNINYTKIIKCQKNNHKTEVYIALTMVASDYGWS